MKNGNATQIDLPYLVRLYREQKPRKSYDDIAALLNKSKATVWRADQRNFQSGETVETNETGHETGEALVSMPLESENENLFLPGKNAVSPVSETRNSVSSRLKTAPMYGVFFTTVATGCYSFCSTLPAIVGTSLAVLYALYCVDCIRTAGDESDPKEAERARNLIVFVEFVAGIAHYFVFHKFLWRNLESLPFEVYETAKDGAWKMNGSEMEYVGTWVNGEWVGFIAAILAALVFVSAWGAAYAIWRRTKV